MKRKNEAAHAVLARRFPTSSAATGASKPKPKAKVPTDPKKRAALRKIEVMKLKHHAVPADKRDTLASVPLEQRLFVKVRVNGGNEEKAFWLRKVGCKICIRVADL